MLLDELGEWGLQAAPSRAVPHTPASGDRKGQVSLSGQACATSLLLGGGLDDTRYFVGVSLVGFPPLSLHRP